MAHSVTTAELTRQLAVNHRVVVLGGLAVIAHGHPRPTYDADAWLDPRLDPHPWAEAILTMLAPHPSLRALTIGRWKTIIAEDLAEVILRDGVIRIMGANQPLDIFRDPNELEMTEFDDVWARALPLEDGTRIPDVVDLLVTKQHTGRTKDTQDIAYLEEKAESEYLARLPTATADEAVAMLSRFLTPKVAEAAARHPAESVRAQGMEYLRELAEAGDPFARDLLEKLGLERYSE